MKTPTLYTPKTRVGRLAEDMVRRYYAHDVARDSAALTYYLLFALFPLLIFANVIISSFDLSALDLVENLSMILPEQIDLSF